MKDDQHYSVLHNVDNQSDSDSNTEVEGWDTDASVKPRRRNTIWRRVKASRWLVEIGLLLIIAGLLAEKRWKHHHDSHSHELAGDVTGFAPTFSQQIVTFKPDPVFAPENASEFWSKETQHAWLNIVPGRSTDVPPCALS
jgi:hypothetical protein